MNNNVEMTNSQDHKRNRNWNNNNNNSIKQKTKRAKLNKRITFKNNVHVKYLPNNNNTNRKPIGINKKNRTNLPNYYTNKKALNEKMKRIKTHTEKIRNMVGNLKLSKKKRNAKK
jgi:hypothetical protein